MKILFGSQNFGYDLPDSDHDYVDIVFPTWDDILHNRVISKELRNDDGSITKVMDIRKFAASLLKGNFSTLQLLFAKEYENHCNIDPNGLKWFINHREEIVYASLWDSYKANMGCMRSMLRHKPEEPFSAKDAIRIDVFTLLLVRQLLYQDSKNNFFLYCPDARGIRKELERCTPETRWRYAINSVQCAEGLTDQFRQYEGKRDEKLIQEMDEEVKRLLKYHLK